MHLQFLLTDVSFIEWERRREEVRQHTRVCGNEGSNTCPFPLRPPKNPDILPPPPPPPRSPARRFSTTKSNSAAPSPSALLSKPPSPQPERTIPGPFSALPS